MHSFIVGDEGRLVGGGWCVPTKSDENRWSVKLPTISHNKITANKVLLRAGRKSLFVDKDNFLRTKSNLSCVMSMDLTDYFFFCQYLLRNMVWECSFNRVVNRLQWESSDLRAFSKCIITYRRRHLATSKHVINITQSIEMFSSQT